jgi:hypothetical protein
VEVGEVEERKTERSSRNRPRLRRSDDEVAEIVEQSGQADSEDSAKSTASSDTRKHPGLEGNRSEDMKYGEFPNPDLCEQLFGELPGKRGDYARYSRVKQRDFVFARDERCRFTFDTVSLAKRFRANDAQYQHKYQAGKIEEFARDLRERGGFFFFRDSYGDGSEEGHNKIYNGTQVYRCLDDMHDALPRFLIDRENFSEELPDVRPLWGNSGEDESLRKGLESRKELSQDIISGKIYGDGHGPREPFVSYRYRGEPRRFLRVDTLVIIAYVPDYGNSRQSPEKNLCLRYRNPHIIAPWRRLW